jgi:membrane protein implicated in regulation of membrane protease activity
MTWSDFYLICFLVGLLLSVVSLVLGDLHFHPHFPFHIHFGGFDLGGADVHGPAGVHGHGGMPAINFGTITTFLAWFGGIGYLLTRHSDLYTVAALGVAILGGLAGAFLVFLFLRKVLLRHEVDTEPEDSDMVGVLGRIGSSVFEGGTGELVYVHRGTRHSCAARSEDGTPISKGSEVVVTRYEKGIAYVRTWEELSEREVAVREEKS